MIDISFLQTLKEELEPVVEKAGKAIMKIYEKDFTFEKKFDGSPVTEADKLAERIIVPKLAHLCPNIPIVSEENSESHKMKIRETFFLVDPLDGTKEFLKRDGKGSFTVNIALIHNKVPIFGLVYAPAINRYFSGITLGNLSQERHGQSNPLFIGKEKTSDVIAVASTSHRDQKTSDWLVSNKIERTISIGSSLKFCLLAAGEADVYPRFGPTMEWDTAAGDAVLRAAGGIVTNTAGNKIFEYGKEHFLNDGFIAWGKFKPKNSLS